MSVLWALGGIDEHIEASKDEFLLSGRALFDSLPASADLETWVKLRLT